MQAMIVTGCCRAEHPVGPQNARLRSLRWTSVLLAGEYIRLMGTPTEDHLGHFTRVHQVHVDAMYTSPHGGCSLENDPLFHRKPVEDAWDWRNMVPASLSVDKISSHGVVRLSLNEPQYSVLIMMMMMMINDDDDANAAAAAGGGGTGGDAGSYRGQWLQGSRHGFGIRKSVPYGVAVHYRQKTGSGGTSSSQTSVHTSSVEDVDHVPVTAAHRARDQGRGGFVLVARSDSAGLSTAPGSTGVGFRSTVARTLRLRKQTSAGDGSTPRAGRRPGRESSGSRSASEDRESVHTDSCTSFVSQVAYINRLSVRPTSCRNVRCKCI